MSFIIYHSESAQDWHIAITPKQAKIVCSSDSDADNLCRLSGRFRKAFPLFIIEPRSPVNENLVGQFAPLLRVVSYGFTENLFSRGLRQMIATALSGVPWPDSTFKNNTVSRIKEHLCCTARG